MREKKEVNIQIGEQIKLAREKCRLTQEQLAERVDVSPQYISDLERGVVGISIPTLKRACTVLGVSSDQILFAQKTQDRGATIIEMCRCLNEKQFSLLMVIIEKYIEALDMAK